MSDVVNAHVRRTAGVLYSEPRTAAKRRRCDGHLTGPHWIEVGDLVMPTALPPGHNDVGNTRWWHAWFCENCWPGAVSNE